MNGKLKLLALFATILVESSAETVHNLRERKLLPPRPRPLEYVAENSIILLAMCQGDCDKDKDCEVLPIELLNFFQFDLYWKLCWSHACYVLEKGWPRMLPERCRWGRSTRVLRRFQNLHGRSLWRRLLRPSRLFDPKWKWTEMSSRNTMQDQDGLCYANWIRGISWVFDLDVTCVTRWTKLDHREVLWS